MSRKTKPRRPDQHRRKQVATQRQRDIDLIHETAACFTCATRITRDFLYQCADGIEALEADLAFNRVAYEMWHDRPGQGQQIAEALAAFIEYRETYLRGLTPLKERLVHLAQQATDDDHLDPIEKYRELIRARMFAEVPPPV